MLSLLRKIEASAHKYGLTINALSINDGRTTTQLPLIPPND